MRPCRHKADLHMKFRQGCPLRAYNLDISPLCPLLSLCLSVQGSWSRLGPQFPTFRGFNNSMEGYPQLAVFQGKHPELRIYRRFSTLNARNLLYLQAELVDLEQKLDRYTTEDLSCDNPQRKKLSRNWYALSKRNNGLYSDQWRTMLCLREKLKEYSGGLALYFSLLTC